MLAQRVLLLLLVLLLTSRTLPEIGACSGKALDSCHQDTAPMGRALLMALASPAWH